MTQTLTRRGRKPNFQAAHQYLSQAPRHPLSSWEMRHPHDLEGERIQQRINADILIARNRAESVLSPIMMVLNMTRLEVERLQEKMMVGVDELERVNPLARDASRSAVQIGRLEELMDEACDKNLDDARTLRFELRRVEEALVERDTEVALLREQVRLLESGQTKKFFRRLGEDMSGSVKKCLCALDKLDEQVNGVERSLNPQTAARVLKVAREMVETLEAYADNATEHGRD